MMHIPTAVAAVLVVRQMGTMLPSAYCGPECPSCKDDVAAFDGATTSCTANSTFITNCGACQTCVQLYHIQNGETLLTNQIEVVLMNILNLCENTSVSAQIHSLQSQASRVSSWGAHLPTASASTTLLSSSGTITPAPTMTGTAAWDAAASGNPSWTTMLSTASWASKYSAWMSSESVAAAASRSSSLANQTFTATSTPNPSETAVSSSKTTTPQPTPAPPLSQSWVAGPVIGSMLGMSTVFIVIFLTRRKQRRDMLAALAAQQAAHPPPGKPFHDSPTSPTSTRSSSAAGGATGGIGEGEPPSETISTEPKELANSEVYELPALEPVGSELNTPLEVRPRMRIGGDGALNETGEERGEEEDWAVQSPLPLSPLPLLFAMSELRDERMGRSESLRHETYYHP